MESKAIKIIGFVIIALIVVIVIADVIMYIKRAGIYSFKAQPAPASYSGSGNGSTKALSDSSGNIGNGISKATTTTVADVYYPNGEPDPTTGKPKGSSTLPSGVSSKLNNNLTAYNTAAIQTNPSDWGPATPSS